MFSNSNLKKYDYLKIIGIKFVIYMAILLSGLTSTYAASVSWQNPKTGRIGTFPEDVSIEAHSIDPGNIAFIFDSEALIITLAPDTNFFFHENFNKAEHVTFKPNAVLKGYPVQIFDDKENPGVFFINMGDRVWGVSLTKGYKHPLESKLFDILLETMKPRQAGDSFKLILPWTDKIIDLGEGEWSASSQYINSSANREPLGISYGKGGNIKNFDSFLHIGSKNADISVNNYLVSTENLDEQLLSLMKIYKFRYSVGEFKQTNIAGKTVWTGYSTKTEGQHISYYLVALKNRIWVVRSYVFGSNETTNAAKQINLVEKIITSLPDNPPDIVTTYTNPQTKKQFSLPEGWAVLQEFDKGEPTDLGIQSLDLIEEEFEDRSPIIYSCAPKIKRGLKFAQDHSDMYRQTHFGERLVWLNDDAWLSVYTSDRLGACYLEIRHIHDQKVELDLAEKLFATGKW